MPSFSIYRFWIQKKGNTINEYEDASAYKVLSDNEENNSYNFAIADGASESSYATEWAKLLTRSYRDKPFENIEDLYDRLIKLSQRWHKIIFRKPLPWFAEEKAKRGSYATFLGINLVDFQNSYIYWKAVGIGDCCLFQVRENKLILSFPIENSLSFDNFPYLFSSNMQMNNRIWDKVSFIDGIAKEGDIFVLGTDAIAAWFLLSYENNDSRWNELISLISTHDSQDKMRDWVERNRQEGMRNDDVTIIVIVLE